MYQEKGVIANLVHLYVDGAFSRRELVQRVARHTGSIAAAVTALSGFEVMHAQAPPACPDGIKVPADAPDIVARDVQYSGEGGTILGYLAYPKTSAPRLFPGVLVMHENQGLLDHHKDVTRRVARAGFVGVAVDLLSRQGGTANFPDSVTRAAAYGKTNQFQRRSDLISTLAYAKELPNIVFNRIGVVGFCAGGGNVWDLISNVDELAAAVPFYGTPVPTSEQIDAIKTPVLGIYAELDRNLTTSMGRVMTDMIAKQKTFGFNVYQGAGHAFNNDTGAAYNPEAACDAWARTIAWFNKFLYR